MAVCLKSFLKTKKTIVALECLLGNCRQLVRAMFQAIN